MSRRVAGVRAGARLAAITIACAIPGCAIQAPRIHVTQQGPDDPPHFARVAIPPFENLAGPELIPEFVEILETAVRRRVAESHEDSFDEVLSAVDGNPQTLIVRGRVASYEPGKVGPWATGPAGSTGALHLVITLIDGRDQSVLEQFLAGLTNLQAIGAGPTMDMKNLSAGIAVVVAQRIARYGKE